MKTYSYDKAVRAAIPVPAHIKAIAGAVTWDLLVGPSWIRIPGGDVTRINADCHAAFRGDLDDDVIEETYASMAGDALRAWIDDLPYDGWVDTDSDNFSETEPEAWFDTGEVDDDGAAIMLEEDLSYYHHLTHRSIVEALLGATIAREFY